MNHFHADTGRWRTVLKPITERICLTKSTNWVMLVYCRGKLGRQNTSYHQPFRTLIRICIRMHLYKTMTYQNLHKGSGFQGICDSIE